ncbi:hypothetical protein BHM03_00000306 [Ensete ventricosum]|uniref:Uncharacterized protein n=1 Tax=Ensete ventricosum TaxID=4639 RepID=A0A445M8C8_ENSVE|nr:hypothetical protein BHM03_00000306 [Ensete ventricosum]
METPLVCKLPNSTSLPPFPGIWNNSPGESSTNSTTATTTGPQSAILSLERPCRRREIKVGEKRKGKAKEKATVTVLRLVVGGRSSRSRFSASDSPLSMTRPSRSP